jgi:uncharacterized membrane protein
VFTFEWQLFARGIGSSFTFLLGLSVAVRYIQTQPSSADWLRTMLRRSAVIFGCGLLVSLGTYFAVGNEFVVFGILHMQGVVMLIAALAILLPVGASAALGLVAIAIGLYLNTLSVPYPWLIWLGITEQGRGMVDYYPLLPWGGFALLGVALGMVVYRSGAALVGTTPLTTLLPIRALRFLGRHSLPIYLIHQPLILGLLMLWGQFKA